MLGAVVSEVVIAHGVEIVAVLRDCSVDTQGSQGDRRESSRTRVVERQSMTSFMRSQLDTLIVWTQVVGNQPVVGGGDGLAIGGLCNASDGAKATITTAARPGNNEKDRVVALAIHIGPGRLHGSRSQPG